MCRLASIAFLKIFKNQQKFIHFMVFGHFKYLNPWLGSLVWSMPWSWVESTAVTALTAVNHSTAVTKAAKTTPKGTIGWSLSHVPTLFRKKLHFKGRVLKIKLSKMYHQSTWTVFFWFFRKSTKRLGWYHEILGPVDGVLRSMKPQNLESQPEVLNSTFWAP